MLVIFGFAALSIDLSRVYQQQRDMQSATDAAALSAAVWLTNASSSHFVSDIVSEATIIAQANGVSTNDLHAIQVGQWNKISRVFFINATPYNAVLVQAQRSIPLMFGKMLGMAYMSPGVHSVVMLTGAGSALNVIPFGIDQAHATTPFYQSYDVAKGDVGGSGNFGQLGLGGNGWVNNMVNGCGCTLAIGQLVDTITGKNGNCDDCTGSGFTDRYNSNPYAIMPVVDNWPSGGSGTAHIVGFVGVKIISAKAGGSWTVKFQNVPIELFGYYGGSTTNSPYALARVLVQ
jgi:hypothetical protein